MHAEKSRCATSYERGVSDPETKVGLLDLRHIMVQSILGYDKVDRFMYGGELP